MKRARMLRSLAAVGCFVAGSAAAAETTAAPPEDAFLEFLGGFETADGEWVDPMALAELEVDGEPDNGRETQGVENDGGKEDET